MKTQNTSRWIRTLAFVAWAAFVVSFFLPSYADLGGYQCAVMHGYFWQGAMQGNWGAVHYLLLTLPNLLMLASPFLIFRFRGYARSLSWLRYATFAALILVWSFLILIMFYANKDGSNLRVGAFVWASSFVILWSSLILPHKGLVEAGGLKHGTLCA
jgi:hypothetical protein